MANYAQSNGGTCGSRVVLEERDRYVHYLTMASNERYTPHFCNDKLRFMGANRHLSGLVGCVARVRLPY